MVVKVISTGVVCLTVKDIYSTKENFLNYGWCKT